MSVKFALFLLISIGIFIVGCSFGYIIGSYVTYVTDEYIYSYFAVPMLVVGSTCIIVGSLYGKNKG